MLASLLRVYQPLLAPGVLQTAAYAKAVTGYRPQPETVDATLAARFARREILAPSTVRTTAADIEE